MARDRAKINTGIWGDSDWKALTMGQQWLYTTLLTRPELNHVGVGDWRPRRISRLASDMSVEQVEAAAAGLSERWFILIDHDTEEVLVRSFLKHDGVLDNPNLGASIKGAYDAVYSATIQRVIVHELQKIVERTPDVPVMKSQKSRRHIQSLLHLKGASIEDALNAVHNGVPNGVPKGRERRSDSVPNGVPIPPTTASTTALGTPSTTAFQKGDPSTTTTTTPSNEGGVGETGAKRSPKSRATELPEDWTINDSHRSKAEELGVDADWEAEKFTSHHQSKGNEFRDWGLAFHTWLRNAAEYSHGKNGKPPPARTAENVEPGSGKLPSFTAQAGDWFEDDYRPQE